MPSEPKLVPERLEEAMREIGILLLAFAPLDRAVSAAQSQRSDSLLYFALLGLSLFSAALLLERRRHGGTRT